MYVSTKSGMCRKTIMIDKIIAKKHLLYTRSIMPSQ